MLLHLLLLLLLLPSIVVRPSLQQSPLHHYVGGSVRVPVVAAHPGVAALQGLEQGVDVVGLGEPLEEGDEVEELAVVHVVEPRGHGNLKRRAFSSHFAYQCHRLTASFALQIATLSLSEPSIKT